VRFGSVPNVFQIDVKDILIQSKTSFGASSPKQIQNSLSKIGLNVSCLRCGNNTFVKQEFIVPIEELTEEYLKKSITKFIQENLNPSVKPN